MATDTDPTYERLLERQRELSYLEDIEEVLSWDEYTVLPDRGTAARSKQKGALTSVIQERKTASDIGRLLDEIDESELDDHRRASVREIRRQYERQAAVQDDLAERISEATSEATEAWQQARAEDDWDLFEDHLDRIIQLKREEAAAIDPNGEPYEVLFQEYAPYTELETVERIFEELEETLPVLIDDIRSSDRELVSDAFEGTFDVDVQVDACEALLDALGYDWERGHTDTVPNAATFGNQFDCRIGLWPFEDDLRVTLLGAIHEFGHALYTQNLPQEHYGTPLGTDRGVYVQESQSTFWNRQIGMRESFWEFAQPILTDQIPSLAATPRELYESYVTVRPEESNVLRSDELSWHLHMLVRFNIEQGLIKGELAVADVPEVWRDEYEEYLGFRPETDAQGPLLTIHWAEGLLGYFPTYTLGPILAAQFAHAAREAIDDFDDNVRAGEFEPIRSWLREEIHLHGQRFTTPELIQRVTGKELGTEAFLEDVTRKYSALYGV